MNTILSGILIFSIALALDFVLGDPPNAVHPLRWMGNLLDRIDRRIMRKGRNGTRVEGLLSYLLIFVTSSLICLVLLSLARNVIGDWAWILLSAVLFKMSFAVYSFREHCRPIEDDLDNGDIQSAREKTQMIVSRDTSVLDEEHVASSCVESVSENLVDSVYSPYFYFGFLGIIGAIMFRCANLMDAMWGYRDERYENLGFFPAKFDDALGFVPSRVSILYLVLTSLIHGADVRGLLRTVANDHDKTPSPNSGWSMAAVSGALGIGMEKEGVYRIGDGPLPDASGISRTYHFIETSSIIFAYLVALPLYIFIGMDVQIALEDALWGILGMIL